MVDFINMDSKLLLAIIGPFLIAVGYFYRLRRENKKNLKVALYALLEIWHRISIFYRRNFNDFFDLALLEIKKQFPSENISEKEIDASKDHISPILMKFIRSAALIDLDGYQDKYKDAISLISSDSPILAYKISSASKVKHLLNSLDSYLEKTLENIEKDGTAEQRFSKSLKSHMSEHAELDSVKDIESDIKRLSFRISVFTWLSCIFTIHKRRRFLNRTHKNEIDNLLKNVLLPAINEFNNKNQTNPDEIKGNEEINI